MKTNHIIVSRERGFSLIEVMVAIVVICIGLLGIAKMQAMALSTTNMSRQRSVAAMEAASFASAMHSNRQYWSNLTVPVTVTISGNNVVQVVGDAALQAQILLDIPGLNDCIGAADGVARCTNPASNNNQRLAAFDLARWWVNSVSQQLPNPTVIVNCPQVPPGNPAPLSCTVQILWSERSIALTANEVQAQQQNGASASEKPNFMLYVEP